MDDEPGDSSSAGGHAINVYHSSRPGEEDRYHFLTDFSYQMLLVENHDLFDSVLVESCW